MPESNPTPMQLAFLRALDPEMLVVRTRGDLTFADWMASHMRQSCRRAGWAEFVRPQLSKAGWLLTEAGREVVRSEQER